MQESLIVGFWARLILALSTIGLRCGVPHALIRPIREDQMPLQDSQGFLESGFSFLAPFDGRNALGSANLPEAQRIDVRQEIAKIAGVGVSGRNVSNVKKPHPP